MHALHNYTNGSYKNRTVNLPGAFGIKEQDQIHVALAGSITWLKIQHRLWWCWYMNAIKIVTSSRHLWIDYLDQTSIPNGSQLRNENIVIISGT